MAIKADYLGMPLSLDDLDGENLEYFRHCAAHDFHLQQCDGVRPAALSAHHGVSLVHASRSQMGAGGGQGAVHSYSEVHHAIQPAFRAHAPYLILLVDLDTQKGKPTEHEALRVVGNLVTPDGKLAPPEMVKKVGIGTRVRMVFTDVAPGLALPQWTIDESARATRQAVALSAGVSAA